MKYLITESQLDRVIFRYLDSQNFIKIEKNNRIYFVNSEGNEYAQIRYDKKNGWCYIYLNLIEDVSVLFSLNEVTSKDIIGNWVGNTLQMEITYAQWVVFSKSVIFSIPPN